MKRSPTTCLELPGTPSTRPVHLLPQLSWKTWVRLAFVEAGKDWRNLNRLAVENGQLRDYLIVPQMHNGGLGVRHRDAPTGVVAGQSLPMNGAFSVADPRAAAEAPQDQQYGVLPWDESMGAIIGVKSPGQGTFSPPTRGTAARRSTRTSSASFAGAAHRWRPLWRRALG